MGPFSQGVLGAINVPWLKLKPVSRGLKGGVKYIQVWINLQCGWLQPFIAPFRYQSMATAIVGETRKAAAGSGSTPDAQRAKTEEKQNEEYHDIEADAEEEMPEGTDNIMKMMYSMMKDLKKDMSSVKKDIHDTKNIAGQAKVEAKMASEAASKAMNETKDLRGQVEQLQKECVKKEDIQAAVDVAIAAKASPSWPQRVATAKDGQNEWKAKVKRLPERNDER